MKKVIIICNTYYQLIMAIQMKRTIKTNENVTLIISDQSNNAESIFKNIKKLGVFDEVFFVESRELCLKQKSRMKAVKDLCSCITGHSKLCKFLTKEKVYDEFVYYNPDIATHFLYAALINRNRNMEVSRYEEGIVSYNYRFTLYPKLRAAYMVRRLVKLPNLQHKNKKFYCVYPEFYFGDGKVVKIPTISINDDKLKKIIADLFSVDTQRLVYKQKYLYFSSIYDIEGEKPVGELELIKKVADLVGRDNLIVKVHPRDDIKRFINVGLTVDIQSSIPWEAIQLNYDFSNHIFLTTASGSVLTISAIMDKAPKTFYLYRLCEYKGNILLENVVKAYEDILKMKNDSFLSEVRIVNEIGEITEQR